MVVRQGQGGARSTREAIVAAAMRLFAEKGYAAASIREIAAAAGTNVASISYHFGGKEGLRAACAGQVVELMGGVLAAARRDEVLPEDPAAATAVLEELVGSVVRFLMLEPRAQQVAGFILREMTHPSEALDTMYSGLFEGVHRRACALWGKATGRDGESQAVRLAVFAMIGQIVYFRLGLPVVERRMGWTEVGAAEAAAVADTVVRNLRARIEADRRHPG
jgi:TetR/AcrR family transcriptional regulator, regulator of cefoperazone and chloramphenicol sensitivity